MNLVDLDDTINPEGKREREEMCNKSVVSGDSAASTQSSDINLRSASARAGQRTACLLPPPPPFHPLPPPLPGDYPRDG